MENDSGRWRTTALGYKGRKLWLPSNGKHKWCERFDAGD